MTARPAAADPALEATQRWFVRRGLPLFIEDYDNGRDVWTRALPALIFLFVFNVVATIPAVGLNIDAGTGDLLGYDVRPVVGAAVGTAVLLLAYALVNRWQGRRALAPPRRVGWPVLVAWVAVPAIITFAGKPSWATFVGDLLLGAAVLLVVWLVTRYALFALLWWAVRRLASQTGDVVRLATKALPLQMLVISLLFFTTELWQTVGTMTPGLLWPTLRFFVALAAGFLVALVHEESGSLELEQTREQVLARCAGTPMADDAPALPDLGLAVPLSRRQRVNLTAALVVMRLIQALLIAVLVWAFLVVFGAVAVSVPVQQAWVGSLDQVAVHVDVFGDHAVTAALMRVSTFLAAFSAFSVTVSGATDEAYRKAFLAGMSEGFARSLAVRRAYLALRRRDGLPAPDPVPASTR